MSFSILTFYKTKTAGVYRTFQDYFGFSQHRQPVLECSVNGRIYGDEDVDRVGGGGGGTEPRPPDHKSSTLPSELTRPLYMDDEGLLQC